MKNPRTPGYFATVEPLAIPGQIIVPMNATDTGGLPGYVYGVGQEDGSILYKANMIPGPDEPGCDSWPGDSRDYGGAGPWIIGSWDPDLKRYYTGTANAYPWNPKTRGDGKMDNVGASFEFMLGHELNLAMDVQSGAEVWRDQKGKSGYADGMLTTAGNLVFYGSEAG